MDSKPRLDSVRIGVALAVLLPLVAPAAPAPAHEPVAEDVAAEMAEAANRFLASLDDAQRERVLLDFNGQQRTFWHYFPSSMLASQGGRPGLPIKEMSPEQRALAHGLLSTALSHKGYLQAMTIVALEAVLRDMEGGSSARDPEMYHVVVFGKPTTKSTWGWRFEGHHVSVNLTLVDGRHFSATPSFFGSNPARVKQGRLKGVEALAAEQQLARRLVQSLSPEQRKLAVIAEKAPRDIITGAERKVSGERFQPPQGIPFEKLDEQQQKMLRELAGQFVAKYRSEIVDQIDAREPLTLGPGTHFAWAGGFEPGEGHYYRIQTPHYLFEYDNTQAGANHIHTVWRQFDGDFGEDLLRAHYETSPHHQEEQGSRGSGCGSPHKLASPGPMR